jgi:prepilin-type N-terminal cleavage/methylation domain-containing protein
MNRKGITLIELLVALTISGILVSGVYRTFISQQHTYTVQEQVVDMQQNVRLAINRMTREIRMANFGRQMQILKNSDGTYTYNTTFFDHGAMYGTFSNVVNPDAGGTSVTVVGAYQAKTTLSAIALTGSNSIFVNDVSSFDTGLNQYISINGVESHRIISIDVANKELQFPGWDTLPNDHQAEEPVYLVMAITYSRGQDSEGKWCLMRDDHLGSGPQPLAENIDNLQFAYFDDASPPNQLALPIADPKIIRMIQLNIIARTDKTDSELAKVGDGFRRRTLNSNIQLRNFAF